jgi:hypothetical protein
MCLRKLFFAMSLISLLQNNLMFGQNRWVNSYLQNDDVFIKDVLESYDKGYLLSGKFGPNYSKYNWLIKTDINGEVLWNKTIGNGVQSIALLDMDHDNIGNIYLGGSTKAYDPLGDPLIIKLNSCGEKEWCTIFHSEDNHDFSRCLALTPEGNILTVLLLTNPDPWVERICLAKLSPAGDLIWKHCYTTSDTSQRNEDVFDIIITPDSGFLISGLCDYEDPTVPNKWWVHPYFLKTDSSGNFEWESVAYKDTELEGGIAFNTVASPDGQHYYSSISHYYHEENFSSPALLKMDLQGNIMAIYDVVYGYENGKLSYARFISDSTLAAEAAWGNTVDSIWSTAVIIDTIGNLLNSTILTEDQFTSILDITYDGKLVYASNIYVNDQFDVILTKLNQNLEQDSIYTYPFIYDSLCPYQIVSDTIVQDDCGLIVGIEEDNTTVELYDGKKGGLEIWPNPAREILNVEFLILNSGIKSSTFNLQYSITVYDIYGRSVPTPTTSPSPLVSQSPGQQELSWEFDVSALPSGIYFVVVRDERSVIGTGKFVVAR